MELVCEKYKDRMESETARCAHPDDYCKFRTSCLIHFMGRERDLEKRKPGKSDQQCNSNT